VKRKASAPPVKSRKRRKSSTPEESEAELSELAAEISDADSEPPKKTVRRIKKVVADESDEEEEAPKLASKPKPVAEDVESDEEPAASLKKTVTEDDLSESEMSSVIDEEPVKRGKKAKAPKAKESKPAKPKAAPKAKSADGPDEAEVKRLQGWLVKCGIRKVWSRDPELSKCSTSKEKIRVLKGMLSDVGMDGKYSVEKAAKIKEEREFAKDLEAIKEGERSWGNATEVTSTGRPSRRAAAKPIAIQKVVLEDDSDEDMDGGGQQDEASSDDDDDDDDVEADSGGDDDEGDEDSGGDDSE